MISLYFGSIGCGKTTFAVKTAFRINKNIIKASIIKNDWKRKLKGDKLLYHRVYTNFLCDVSNYCTLNGLGDWTFPPKSKIIVDESGIEYNNRKYKSLPQSTIEWFKLSRHYRCDLDFYSQSWEDTDITIRRLAERMYYCKKIGPVTIVRRIKKFVHVDDETKQIIDGYEFYSILWGLLPPPFRINDAIRFVWRPKYYKYFNSYHTPDTPIKRTFGK